MRALLVLFAFGWAACTPAAQPTTHAVASGDCDGRHHSNDRERACETREFVLDARPLRVDAAPNGGVSVSAWDRDEIRVVARVETWARTQQEADALLRQVEIQTAGSVRARLPEPRDDAWASVSYEIQVPRDADLDLRTVNGGIDVREVMGTVRFHAVNGGVQLNEVGGDVSGETANGGIAVRLARGPWRGAGLDVTTTNGGIEVDVPPDVSAEVDARTAMGPVHIDGLPLEDVKCENRASSYVPCMGGHAVGTLGRGGAPIRLATRNGGISLRRR